MNAKLEMSEEEADRRVVEQKEKKVAELTGGLEDERKAIAEFTGLLETARRVEMRQRWIIRCLSKR